MRRNEEQQLQIACAKYLALKYPRMLFCAITIENKRSAVTGAIHKAMGQKAGMPDLFIAEPMHLQGQLIAGVFVEFKTQKGVVSAVQKGMHEALISRGYVVEICRTLDSFIKIINTYYAK